MGVWRGIFQASGEAGNLQHEELLIPPKPPPVQPLPSAGKAQTLKGTLAEASTLLVDTDYDGTRDARQQPPNQRERPSGLTYFGFDGLRTSKAN